MLWLSETSVVETMGDQENNTGIWNLLQFSADNTIELQNIDLECR